ncbi:Transcriptional antiterminator [Edwardsiella anguillarum]|uniref:PRD domain-containing protein n=1 Tax=Edwardsiella TaxID=635 RepID=UPI00045C7FCD|nr:PRD domain-containing protein [Edwardsiella anguillarum]AKM46987.1 transcriptional antiterminator [Edwardsiella sp. EA181011]GAJ67234.1 transcriptional antiterminator BglG2 [Edwardsiella piscicida]RFT04688.1 PRD domain-containing protein [Edwardsiella anguillarum]BET81822.1 Transcriptional antiterminator [Edwardsiella anguillarum]BET85251.1 Transcriptional antiterminator [Edwardsiella anguillarum]
MQNDVPLPPPHSRAERHCNLALRLLLPTTPLTMARLCKLQQQTPYEAERDLSHLVSDIMRYHALYISFHPRHGYRLHGPAYEWRLCLLHWLQRTLRYFPANVELLLSPALHPAFSRQTLYERLQQRAPILESPTIPASAAFTPRQLIGCMMLYAAAQGHGGRSDSLMPCWLLPYRRRWLEQKEEYAVAEALCRIYIGDAPADVLEQERLFATLLLTLLKNHSHSPRDNAQDRALMHEIERCVDCVERDSDVRLSQRERLCARLFAHLGAAVERALFDIRIGTPLAAELASHHPALLALTRRAIAGLERHYRIRFSPEELSLIAVSIGAWLMQAGRLQEPPA